MYNKKHQSSLEAELLRARRPQSCKAATKVLQPLEAKKQQLQLLVSQYSAVVGYFSTIHFSPPLVILRSADQAEPPSSLQQSAAGSFIERLMSENLDIDNNLTMRE